MRYFSARPHLRLTPSLLYQRKDLGKELFALAIPLTSTRILMNLLQSVESISIPLCLQKYGYTNSEALSTYGVLTGMALPCIMFPTAITNSVSTMLLPTVAEIQAEDDLLRLKQLIRRVIFFGFGLGAVCGIVFLLFGSLTGKILFGSSLAGDFMRTLAWICPFMYMNTTLISILNGLGKANSSFVNNVCGLAIRITGVWFGIGMFPAVFIIFMGCVFPILVYTIDGVKRTDKVLIESAQTLGASDWNVLKRVILPSAVPYVVSGLKVGIGIALMCTISAEMVGSSSGLGYMILTATSLFDPGTTVVGMLDIGLIGIIFDYVFTKAQERIFW